MLLVRLLDLTFLPGRDTMSAQWTATRPDSPFVESAKTAPLGPPPPNGAVAFVTRALDNSVRLHYNAVDDWTRLDRFLVLGSEKSTYYVQARELTRRNAEAVLRCIGNDGRRSHRRDQPGTWRSPFEHRAWQ